MNYKVTKVTKLFENTCAWGDPVIYYKVNFRVYSDDKKRYMGAGFIFKLDLLDVAEYLDKDTWTKKERDCAMGDFLTAEMESLCDGNYNLENRQRIIDDCNRTIINYNRRNALSGSYYDFERFYI